MKHLTFWLALLAAPASVSAGVVYDVSLDTSSLLSSAAGPFSLSFQMADGSATGDGNNAAILSGFQFGSGAPSGSPLLIGSAFGDLSSQVFLTDASGVAFFAQTFNPGASLQFQLTLTTNVDSGPTPDAFTLSILDSTFTPIPTLAGAPLDMLAEIDIGSSDPTVTLFAGDTSRSPAGGGGPIAFSAPQITLVTPEPNTWFALAIGLCGFGRLLRKSGK